MCKAALPFPAPAPATERAAAVIVWPRSPAELAEDAALAARVMRACVAWLEVMTARRRMAAREWPKNDRAGVAAAAAELQERDAAAEALLQPLRAELAAVRAAWAESLRLCREAAAEFASVPPDVQEGLRFVQRNVERAKRLQRTFAGLVKLVPQVPPAE